MAQDARVRYTQMVIKESFIQLNAKKPLTQITVKEICDRAEINRSTFYRNYVDVYDLKDRIEEDFLQQIKTFIHDKHIEGAEQTVLHILVTMKEHQDRYTSLHDIPSQRLLLCIVEECFADKKNYLLSVAPHLSPKEIRWYFEYISTGCAAIMIDWVKSGMKESPHEVAKFISALICADSSVLK